MAVNYHEKLADEIVKEIKEARCWQDCRSANYETYLIGLASKVAKGKSRLEKDIKKYMKEYNDNLFDEDQLAEEMQKLSARVGKNVNFSTLPLFTAIERRLIRNLQDAKDLWETTINLYAIAGLYYDDKEKISKVIYDIKGELQRRYATIVARVFFKDYEELFEIFSIDTKI